ncbi:MAG: hypothetical protein ACRCYP_07420 [Alphaproteobacteria bacterium]
MRKEFNAVSIDDLENAGYRKFLPNRGATYTAVYMKDHSPTGPNVSAILYDWTDNIWKDFQNTFVFESSFQLLDGKEFKVSISDDYSLQEIEAFFAHAFKVLDCVDEGWDDDDEEQN